MTDTRMKSLVGSIDSPRPSAMVARDELVVAGWVLDGDQPPVGVALLVDGVPRVWATLGSLRPDVAVDYPDRPGASLSGWMARVDLSTVERSFCELTATAVRADGRAQPFGQVLVGFDSSPSLVGRLDQPEEGAEIDEVVHVTGWAILRGADLARVEIHVGDAVLAARVGLPRPDVAERYMETEAPVAGFEAYVELPPGETTVAVTVVGGGRSWPLGEVRVRRHPAPVVEPVFVPAGPATHRPRGEIHVLVVTHHLGLGGAQLYLQELLRRLAAEPWLSGVVVSEVGGVLTEELADLGFAVHVTGDFPVHDAHAYEDRMQELMAWATPQRFDVVLANTLKALPGVDLAGRLGLPAVLAVRESYSLPVFQHVDYGGVHPHVAARMKNTLASAEAVVFEAAATRDLFNAYGSPERLLVVPCGIDLDEFNVGSSDRGAARQAFGLDDRAIVLLCVSVPLSPRKGQALLVQAFARVATDFPDAALVLAGDQGDAYSTGIRAYVERMKLSDRVHVLAATPDVRSIYAGGDVLVSASDVESQPRTMLEAMAMGLPVLATNVFGIPELVQDGRTGWLYKANDLGALEGALRRVLALSRAERETAGQAAAEQVRTRHDGAEHARRYSALLRGLVAHSQP